MSVVGFFRQASAGACRFPNKLLLAATLLFILAAISLGVHRQQTLGCFCVVVASMLTVWGLQLHTMSHVAAATFAFYLGFTVFLVALFGLGLWLEADWFADAGPFPSNSWSGYSDKHFIGLVLLTIGAPVGVTLSVMGLHVLCRSHKSRIAARYNAVRYAVGVMFICLGGAGTWWGWIMGRCLGAFCLNPAVWTPAPSNSRPTAGYGWMATVGITAFFSLLPLGCILCVSSALALTARYRARAAKVRPEARRPTVASPFHMHRTPVDVNQPLRPTGWHVFWFLLQSALVLLMLIAFALVSMYMPNSWEYFSADRIAEQASWRLSLNYTLCNSDSNTYACSDYPWAYFGAWNLELNSGWWIVRLFPSSVFWFSYFILMLVGAAVVTASGRNADPFTRPRLWNLCVTTIRMSLAQASGLLVTILMLSLFAVYWFHDHNFDTLGGAHATGIAYSERYARAFGQLAVAMMGLLVLPASRNSILHTTLGTSWEGFLWVHRMLGYGMLTCTVAHVLAWWVKFGQMRLLTDIFQVPMTMPTNADNFTVPLITITTFILLFCMGILALEPVRRRAFEVFYYAHLFAAYSTIPAVLWHAAAGWEYLLPGLTVWFTDRLLRHVRSSRTAKITEISVCSDGVTMIRFEQPELDVRPGQYVFAHIAEISALEWHPFTVSSIDNENHSFTLHIKAMLPQVPPFVSRWVSSPASTWTQRLHNAALNRRPLTLSIDGPCGPQHDISHFKKIIIIAGGIGITPCAALIDRLRSNLRIHDLQLHWTLREPELAVSFRDQLAPGDNPRYEGTLYVTRDPRCALDQLPLSVRLSRPNFDQIFDNVVDPTEPDPSTTFVFVCGPPGMVENCAQLALARGFTFHEETFFL